MGGQDNKARQLLFQGTDLGEGGPQLRLVPDPWDLVSHHQVDFIGEIGHKQ